MTPPPDQSSSPDIGIFDSGLGGLSVLRALQEQRPSASVLYLADTANVPYGDKPVATVRALALRLTDYLVHSGAGLVLMASGTSTVAGLDAARQRYPHLPLLGTVEPGALAAVIAARSDAPVGVISTNATARSLAFTQAIQKLDPARRVVEVGCPKFVPLVESGLSETDAADEAAREYLRPLCAAGARVIVLGCTHFPFLLPALRRAARRLGDSSFAPLFVDPSEEAVRRALLLLPHSPSSAAPIASDAPRVSFAASGDPEDFRRHASALLGYPLPPVAALRL